MRRFLLLLLVTVSLSATAQFRPYRDVVYLNDSSVIRGKILFGEPDSTLFVDTPYGCTFAYTKDEVLRFELQPQVRHKGFVLQSGTSVGYTKGYNLAPIVSDIYWGFKYRTGSLYSVGLNVKHQMSWKFTGNADMDISAASSIQISQRLYFTRKPISPYCELNIGLSLFCQELSSTYYYQSVNSFTGDFTFFGFFENAWYYFTDWGTCHIEIGCSIRNLDVALNGGISFYHHTFGGFGYGIGHHTISLRLGYSLPIN